MKLLMKVKEDLINIVKIIKFLRRELIPLLTTIFTAW